MNKLKFFRKDQQNINNKDNIIKNNLINQKKEIPQMANHYSSNIIKPEHINETLPCKMKIT